jgi:quercetin dioxygenase-like cupin family protein
MIPDDIQALALADAIGALDPDERRDLENRLASLPADVRAEVAHLYDAAVEIALTTLGEAPSPHVRADLLAKIAAPSNHTVTRGVARSNHTVMAGDGEWVQTPLPGVRMKILALDRARNRVTMLVRGEPGATYPAHRHTGPEECYVIRGSVVVEGQLLRAGDFHHAESDSDHQELHTEEGVEVLLVAAASDYLPESAKG